MKNSIISIIAAIGRNRELGRDRKLLWNISRDLKRFRELTSGHPVIMGRTTFQSIGRPLPDRTNIILTRDRNFRAEGCSIKHSIRKAIELAKSKDKREIFIIGGGQIYEQALKYADKLYLTLVEGNFEADTFFPDYSEFKKVIYQKEGLDNGYRYKFLELVKPQ